ncbi:unnamed protein product, partial [Candidula unifasciata]
LSREKMRRHHDLHELKAFVLEGRRDCQGLCLLSCILRCGSENVVPCSVLLCVFYWAHLLQQTHIQ